MRRATHDDLSHRRPHVEVVRGIRPEIQALRAVAVAAVVLYHLWPLRLPGGFVGVDMFFAVSGFLITAHLLREVETRGSVRITTFWARRARRLLPASLVVLVATSVAVLLVVPRALWQQFFRAIGASVLYVENWLLAGDSVDYLAAENAPTPVQHFWSLGVEEQFYLLWPVLIAVGALVAARSRKWTPSQVVGSVIGLIFVASLVASVLTTSTAPSLAYFGTHIRAWEFAAGGLVALLGSRPLFSNDVVRTWTSWTGWVLVVVAVTTFDGSIAFPGATALVPVVGTLMVVAGGTPGLWWSPTRIVSLRPVQRLGDVSYSFYLWHWPVIVLVPFATGRDLTTVDKSLILVATLGLAALTKKVVEDRVRSLPALTARRPRRTFLAVGASMALAMLLPVAGTIYTADSREQSVAAVDRALASGERCFGAGALVESGCTVDPGAALLPDPASLYEDTGGAFSCYRPQDDPELNTSCSFGSTDPDATRVALVGDSHAAMLIPGLRDRAAEMGWRLDVLVGNDGSWRDPASAAPGSAQEAYLTALDDHLAEGDYDIVLTTARHDPARRAAVSEEIRDSYVEVWNAALRRGTQVVAIQDNPLISQADLDCVVSPQPGVDPTSCAAPASAASDAGDDIVHAARDEGVPVVDLRDHFCTADSCPVVIGGVIVYRDLHHITATFSKTLGPYLVAALEDATTT